MRPGPTARHHFIRERLRWPVAQGRGLARPGHLLRQPARRISLDDLGMLFRQDLSDRAADFLRQPAIGSLDREVTPLIVAEKCLAPLAPEGRPLTFRRDGSLLTYRWREMDSNLWYRCTKARDFRRIPGIAGGSSTGESDVVGGLRRDLPPSTALIHDHGPLNMFAATSMRNTLAVRKV